jgi:hypothetical protein
MERSGISSKDYMNSTSRNKLFGLGLAALVLVGGGCLQGQGKKDDGSVTPTPTLSGVATVRPEFPGMEDVLIPEDWKEFKDEELGISFRYPGYMRFVSMNVEGTNTSNSLDHFYLTLASYTNTVCAESISIGLATDAKTRNIDNGDIAKQGYRENFDQSNPDMYGVEYARWVKSIGSGYKFYYVSGEARNSSCFDMQRSEDGRKILQDYRGVLKSLEIKIAPANDTLTLPKIIRPEIPSTGSENIVIPSDWKEFKDESLGVSFRYSPDMTLESATGNSPDGFGFELAPKSKTVCNDKIFIGLTTDTIARKMGYKDDVGQRYSENLQPTTAARDVSTLEVEYVGWVLETGKEYKFYYVIGDAYFNCFYDSPAKIEKIVGDYKTVLRSLRIDTKE